MQVVKQKVIADSKSSNQVGSKIKQLNQKVNNQLKADSYNNNLCRQ